MPTNEKREIAPPSPFQARGRRSFDAAKEELTYLRGGRLPRKKQGIDLYDVLVAILLCGVLLGVAVPPGFVSRRGPARLAACKNNLRQVAMACAAYAAENEGRYPDRLEQLYAGYVDNAKVFSCPAAPSTWQDYERGTAVSSSSSYVLVAGLKDTMKSSAILLCERLNGVHLEGHRAVAYLDGRVEHLSETELQRNLKAHLSPSAGSAAEK